MKLGKLGHVCIVVNDIEAAAKYYGTLFNIKAWYEMQYDTAPIAEYQGETIDGSMRLFVGGKGFTQIELIQPLCEKGIYVDYLKSHGEGLHHIMYTSKNLNKDIAECENAGMKVLFRAKFESAGTKVDYAYVGKSATDAIVELVEAHLSNGMLKGAIPFEKQLGCLTGNYKKIKI